MPRSRATRVLRGTLAASAATFLALVSHVTAGGAIPGWVGVAVPWVLSVAICTLLAGRALSVVRLSLAVAASQFIFHTLFVLGMFGGTSASSVALTSHDHSAMPTMSMLPAAAAPLAGADAGMWVWHGVAAIATIAVIHRGERAVRRLGVLAAELRAWVRRRIQQPILVLVPAVAPRLPIVRVPRAITSPGWHPSAIGLRGPPHLHAI